jgi:hypothetical protein
MTMIRVGKGYSWELETATQHLRGFTVDNLDTKKFESATTDFERIFITLREAFKANESRCLDNETDRLAVCQAVAEEIKKNRKTIFKEQTQNKKH